MSKKKLIIGAVVLLCCCIAVLFFWSGKENTPSNLTMAEQIREKSHNGETLTDEEQRYRINSSGYPNSLK